MGWRRDDAGGRARPPALANLPTPKPLRPPPLSPCQALTGVIKRSAATTMMGLERELKDAAATLERCNATAISLRAGCELFLRFTTRTSALELADFDAAKAHIVDVRPLRGAWGWLRRGGRV